jgi:hypothetical protein
MPRVARLTQKPYHATNISAASDGVCTRTSTLWFGHRSSLSFLFSHQLVFFIERESKKGWSLCGLNLDYFLSNVEDSIFILSAQANKII